MADSRAPDVRTSRRRLGVVVAAAVVGVTALAGCVGDGSAGSSAAGGAGGAAAEPPSAAGGGAAGGSGGDSGAGSGSGGGSAAPSGGTAGGLVPLVRQVVQRVGLSVAVADVAKASAAAEEVVRSVDGFVEGEEARLGGAAAARQATLVLRVPARRLDAVLDRLAGLGSVRERTRSAEDVTEQVVDVESRLSTQRASVERVRRLLADATTIGQVVSVEGQLASREADLESLQQRAAQLSDLTRLATVTLTLVTRPAAAAGLAAAEETAGFTGGLASGWAALLTTLSGTATVLGAVLPFAALAALVGLPLLWVLRWRRSGPAAGPTLAGPPP